MTLKDMFLAQFDREAPRTHRVLEQVPTGQDDWKPHEKSFSLGGLAMHLARLPHWGTQILEGDAYDAGMESPPKPDPGTLAEVLAAFDRNVTEVRRAPASIARRRRARSSPRTTRYCPRRARRSQKSTTNIC